MKTTIAAGAALAALLTATQPAQAWGPKGHQVVVYIARHYVEQYDVQNKTQITARMDALLALPTQPSSVMSSFADKGNWGDKIKYDNEDDNLRTRNWHFIDIDVDADLTKPNVVDIYCKAQPPTAGTLPSAGGPDDCAVSKIHQFRAALSNKALKDEERELALLYLMHLVGDLHQPLHAAERQHDSGGNGVNIVLPKQTYGNTLHGFWDGHVGRCDTDQAKPWCVPLGGGYQVIGDKLIQRIDAANTTGWTTSSVEDWAKASHTLAKSMGYGGLTSTKASCLFKDYDKQGNPLPPKKKTCNVTKASYELDASKVTDQQLMYAGYRLAAVIIEGLKKG